MKTLLATAALAAAALPAIAQDVPPYVAPPADADTVMVMVELTAADPDAFRDYLASAPVIPVTRLASGINYSWSMQNPDDPATFILIQEWTSAEQHARYIDWRVETGALEELTDQLSEPPRVIYLDRFDTDTLPAQVGES
ncbi:MAG: hypothetical protein AAF264_07740 [Pseudomonadota bacterium]